MQKLHPEVNKKKQREERWLKGRKDRQEGAIKNRESEIERKGETNGRQETSHGRGRATSASS